MSKKLTDITKTHKLEDLVKKFYPGPLDKSDQTEKINTHGLQPKPRDEKQFMRFHRVEKHADRNGNKEDVFNASKIEQVKTVHHGRTSEKASERAAFEPTETSIGESRQNWWRGVDDLPKSKVKKWLKGDDIGDVKKSMAKGKFKEKMCKDGDKKACKEFKEETLTEGKLSVDAHELVLHGDNDYQLHRSSHEPIVKNLQRKHDKGVYNHTKSKTLWKYHADRAAQSYHKQHGHPSSKWHEMFPVHVRHEAASHWADHNADEHGWSKKVNEDRVDELSKRVYADYIPAASDSRAMAQHDMGKMKGQATGKNRDDKALSDVRKSDDYKEARKTSDKRAVGIEMATRKLTKENVDHEAKAKKLGWQHNDKTGWWSHPDFKYSKVKSAKHAVEDHDDWAKSAAQEKSNKGVKSFNIKVNKESEQLDELSTKTLKSYAEKAGPEWAGLNQRYNELTSGDPSSWKHLKGSLKNMKKHKEKRAQGLVSAQLRINKREDVKEEAEQLDELKKSTLASYTKKAASSLGWNSSMGGYTQGKRLSYKASNHWGIENSEKMQKRHDVKAFNRERGIMRATDRLTGTFQHRGDKSKKYKGK